MRAAAETLGAAGVLGIGMAIFCAAFYWSALLPAQRELAAAQSAAAGASSAPRPTLASHAGGELAQLHARFPPLEALTTQVERLHRLGRGAGLQLQRGEYRLDAQGAGLAAYRVSLPVRGPYAALRRFLARVLKEMPLASVDRLRFERKQPVDAELDAQIQLTLFFRPPRGAESQ